MEFFQKRPTPNSPLRLSERMDLQRWFLVSRMITISFILYSVMRDVIKPLPVACDVYKEYVYGKLFEV